MPSKPGHNHSITCLQRPPKESSPQPGIELITTRSWVRHAHHWATRAGLVTLGFNATLTNFVQKMTGFSFRIIPIYIIVNLQIAKSIESCQPARTAQTDMSLYFLEKLLNLFPKQALVLTCLQYKFFENTVGKGEIARNEQFLLFPTVFSTHL